jgi:hypothetical protein
MSQNSDLKKSVVDEVCCGGPAPDEIDACCTADAAAKNASNQGCGCTPSGSTVSCCN